MCVCVRARACVCVCMCIYSHAINRDTSSPASLYAKISPFSLPPPLSHLLSILPSILHGYTLDNSFLHPCYVRAAFVYHSKVLSFRVLVSFSLSVNDRGP